jgi:signal transduction histidine kinase
MRGRLYRGAFFPLDDGGVVAHYRDVTDSRRLEDQLRESQRMASVGQLAAGAAHEINNPLGFLISNLNTLEGYFDEIRRTLARVSALQTLVQSGQAERALDVLRGPDLVQGLLYEALEDAPAIIRESRDGGRRVHEIVKALKELSAIDTTDRRTAEDPWTMVERAAKRAGLPPTRIAEAERVKVQVLVEPLQLEIALANVLRNAMQASDEDTPVQIGVGRDGEWAVISISDSGVGMTPEVRGRVFDPFFTTRGVGGGLGLGLTAAYGIVTRHGGSITLESEPGMGTQVLIRLPAVSPSP